MSADERPEPPRLTPEDVERLRLQFVQLAADLQPIFIALQQVAAAYGAAMVKLAEAWKARDRPDGDQP